MRQKLTFFIGVLLILGVFSLPAGAGYTLQPSDADLADLDHSSFYVWQVSAELEGGQPFDSASLSFDNINNWRLEPGNVLYVHIMSLDDVTNVVNDLSMSPVGPDLYRGIDNQSMNYDAFAGWGYSYGDLLTTYSDANELPEDHTYTFDDAGLDLLNSYIADDGGFGIAFDSDCHYYNDGITLTIGTPTTIPAPGAILLGSVGLGLVGWFRKRRTL